MVVAFQTAVAHGGWLPNLEKFETVVYIFPAARIELANGDRSDFFLFFF
jgi:hypothetical protein